jgi:fibronectin-binding autotransporter adhesin
MKMRTGLKQMTLMAVVAAWFGVHANNSFAVIWDAGVSAASASWYTAANWNPDTVPTAWLTTDIAQFDNSGTATTAVIDMGTASATGVGSLSIAAIETTTARTRALTISNSSSSVDGILTLNGAAISISFTGSPVVTSNVIVHKNNTSTGALTFSKTGSGGRTLTLDLVNPTNIVAIDSASGTLTISSNITGAGGLTLMRAATSASRFDVSGTNTYAGDTHLRSGVLRARVAANVMPHGVGKGNLRIAAGATFSMDFSNTINGLNDGLDSLGFSGGGTVFTNDATSVVLTVGDGDADGSFSGTIVSTQPGSTVGFAKMGSGTQVLSGANTYNGTTAVNAGALIVNGSHIGGSGYIVAGGATLGGNGTISAGVDLTGTIAAGATTLPSPDTLTIGGLTLQNGSTGIFDLVNTPGVHAPGAGNDLIDITGALTGLAATTVSIDVDAIGGGDLTSTGTWTLALYDSLAGTGVPAFTVSGIDAGLSYSVNVVPDNLGDPTGAGSVQLTVVPEPGSLILMGLGVVVGMAGWRRQQRCAK